MTFKKIPQSLGEDILEGLIKSQVYKPETNTNIDLEEVALAYKIVPKSVLTWAIIEFGQMKMGGVKEIPIPFKLGYQITVNKHSQDVFSGELYLNGSIATRFKFKPLVGIALVTMSALELYDIPVEEKKQEESHVFSINDQLIDAKINAIVMEKLLMQNMISSIVDKTIRERDAIKRLIELREKEAHKEDHIDHSVMESEAEDELEEDNKKESIKKLKDFLNKKSKEKIQPIQNIDKSITCDCGRVIHKNASNIIKLCTCYGEFMDTKLEIVKNDTKCTISFPKDFGINNMEMLLTLLKKNN